MNKKEAVRDWLKKAPDNTEFTVSSLASIVGVTGKDVSNVVSDMTRGGALAATVTRDGAKRYTLDSNNTALFFVKYPLGTLPKSKLRLEPKSNGSTPPVVQTRAAPRSPLVRAIDDEIKECERKITRLKIVRREFAS